LINKSINDARAQSCAVKFAKVSTPYRSGDFCGMLFLSHCDWLNLLWWFHWVVMLHRVDHLVLASLHIPLLVNAFQ